MVGREAGNSAMHCLPTCLPRLPNVRTTCRSLHYDIVISPSSRELSAEEPVLHRCCTTAVLLRSAVLLLS